MSRSVSSARRSASGSPSTKWTGRPVDHAVEALAAGGLGPRLHGGEVAGDDVAQAQPLAPDRGRLLHERRAKDRFQPPHQPAGPALDVGRRGGPADDRLPAELEEDRARDRPVRALQGQQRRTVRAVMPEGGVRRAEIEAAGRHRVVGPGVGRRAVGLQGRQAGVQAGGAGPGEPGRGLTARPRSGGVAGRRGAMRQSTARAFPCGKRGQRAGGTPGPAGPCYEAPCVPTSISA
ncbi:hypothetical protein ABIC20_001979 [Methylobacterium radiotolerans]|uniref:Uncharacterized protein n=1 Tax=Methylobacterium radiotolerans TaxID=31998 RepID=A0ABV2NDV7_9HYPH